MLKLSFNVKDNFNDDIKKFSNKSITKYGVLKFDNINTNYKEIEYVINKSLKNKPLVLIGGQTASSLYYGYRSLRKPSTDIDVFVNEKALERIAKEYDMIKYYDNSYIIPNKLPLVFHLNKIHDYEPDNYFYAHIRNYNGILINPPEYTIALKLKRAKEHHRLFGKDRIDIANIFLSYTNNKIGLDIDQLTRLLKEFKIPKQYMEEIKYKNNLKNEETKLIEKEIDRIKKKL